MDVEGYKLLWPDEEPRIGKRFEMNDHEAEIVGICKASRTFQTFPVVYTRYSQALRFVPPERKVLSFVLADASAGSSVDEVCRRIEKQTGPAGRHRRRNSPGSRWTISCRRPASRSTSASRWRLGFVVGTAIAGPDVLLVHDRKHQAVRRAQSDGRRQLEPDVHDLAASAARELHRLWPGHRCGRVVRHAGQRARFEAGVLHADGSVRRHGARRRGDQHPLESVEHAARDGGRTGRGVSRYSSTN